MKKLTFGELVSSQQRMSHHELLSILGGQGKLTGGSGTSASPYIISATYFTDGDVPGASEAVSQFMGPGSSKDVVISGITYRYDIQVIRKDNLAEAEAAANAIGYGNIITKGTARVGGNEGSGAETWANAQGNKITINTAYTNSAFSGALANQSGVAPGGNSGLSKAKFSENVLAHEMLHTLGVGQENTGGAMTDVTTAHAGSLTGPVIGFQNQSANMDNLTDGVLGSRNN